VISRFNPNGFRTKKSFLRYALSLLLAIGCLYQVNAQQHIPADLQATPETRYLLNSMHRLSGKGVLFGHHDDTAYGVNWRLKADSSDIRNVTGSYPAVYSWDLSGIETDSLHDINGIPFATQSKLVREAYERGGINTFCWHMANPVTGKTSWDTSGVLIKDILPGGSYHELYRTQLDKVAAYLHRLKGKHGEYIPILFRPFHELNGNWFWWGLKNGSKDDFIKLWQFTVDYLKGAKNVHQLLMVYSVANIYSELDLVERYPGDNYADIIGFDNYCTDITSTYTDNLNRQLEILQQVTTDRNKLSCIAETGYQGIPTARWWTQVLAPVLLQYKTLSYVVTWRNHGSEHYFAPYPGQASAADFVTFYKDANHIFQNTLTPVGVYGPEHAKWYNKPSKE